MDLKVGKLGFCFFILIVTFCVIVIDNSLAQTLTTVSATCGNCYKQVASSAKVGDYCPYCNVRWGYENSKVTSSSATKSKAILKTAGSITNSNSANNTNPRTTGQKSQDNSTATKAETQEWILSKFNAYGKDRNDCEVLQFVFEDQYFKIMKLCGYGNNKSQNYIRIPIYDIKELVNDFDQIIFETNNATILRSSVGSADKSVSDIESIRFSCKSETDIVKRIERAFLHLKKFYTKPVSKEPF